MRNPRLLHAAARGAVIEMRYSEGGQWHHCNFMDVGDGFEQRIRPGDEHLQYGPIATFLRTQAITSDYRITTAGLLASVLTDSQQGFRRWGTDECSASEHRATFLLLLAEFVTDEDF